MHVNMGILCAFWPARKLKEAENVPLGVKFNVIFPVGLVKSGLEVCISNNL